MTHKIFYITSDTAICMHFFCLYRHLIQRVFRTITETSAPWSNFMWLVCYDLIKLLYQIPGSCVIWLRQSWLKLDSGERSLPFLATCYSFIMLMMIVIIIIFSGIFLTVGLALPDTVACYKGVKNDYTHYYNHMLSWLGSNSFKVYKNTPSECK